MSMNEWNRIHGANLETLHRVVVSAAAATAALLAIVDDRDGLAKLELKLRSENCTSQNKVILKS